MSGDFEYINTTYGVSAKIGGRVRVKSGKFDRTGTITGADRQYINVRWDGEKRSVNLHPTWNVEYLNAD